MPYQYKSQVAAEYFPTVAEKTALRYLLKEIALHARLLAELEEAGYRTDTQRFSPREIEILHRHLGEP